MHGRQSTAVVASHVVLHQPVNLTAHQPRVVNTDHHQAQPVSSHCQYWTLFEPLRLRMPF